MNHRLPPLLSPPHWASSGDHRTPVRRLLGHTLGPTLAVAALLAAGLCAPLVQAHSVVGATPADVALATSVQTALLGDTIFQGANVDITVRAWQGKINLSGWISNVNDDLLARKIAGKVSGVGSVTSNFRGWSSDSNERSGLDTTATPLAAMSPNVVGATFADMALAGAVRGRLLSERVFQAADVELTVRAADGRVNLSGWIADVQDDATARQIASTVPGVKRVTSNFHSWSTDSDMPMLPPAAGGSPVSSAAAPTVIGATPADRALATEVRDTLLSAGAFRDLNTNLVVRANKGRVNLSGWISFASNAAKVRHMASRVTGVRTVTSNFHSWSSETDPRL